MELIYDNINNYSQYEYDVFLNNIKKLKRNKINKLININDRKRSILGELLLIKLLNKIGIDYNSIKISINKNGKPYIENKNIYFNISHSHDYVICVVSTDKIGVDIEKIRDININIIKQFATINEIKYIRSEDKNTMKKAFEIFTLKESYFKYLGNNLNDIKGVEFNINGETVFCSDNFVDCSLNYQINGYIIAICKTFNS